MQYIYYECLFTIWKLLSDTVSAMYQGMDGYFCDDVVYPVSI